MVMYSVCTVTVELTDQFKLFRRIQKGSRVFLSLLPLSECFFSTELVEQLIIR